MPVLSPQVLKLWPGLEGRVFFVSLPAPLPRQPGDYIGFSYDHHNPVPYDVTADCRYGNTLSRLAFLFFFYALVQPTVA